MLEILYADRKAPGSQSPNPFGTDKKLVAEISRAASIELVSSNAVAINFQTLFSSLLVNSTGIRMIGSGIGIGREVKTSFSNILGRSVARAYLEFVHDIKGLRSIDRNNLDVGAGRSVWKHRTVGNSNYPDFFGVCQSDQTVVLAEAKGAYHQSRWNADEIKHPPSVWGGLHQIANCRIVHGSTNTRVKPKGWVVACRWATEAKPKQASVIYAVDPKASDQVGVEVLNEMLRVSNEQIDFAVLRRTGLDSRTPQVRSEILAEIAVDNQVMPYGANFLLTSYGLELTRESIDSSEYPRDVFGVFNINAERVLATPGETRSTVLSDGDSDDDTYVNREGFSFKLTNFLKDRLGL